ncbi:MAG TPA: hypothetical protein VFI08_01350, partial [Spirochaetia bacterium]|nr:hypothetical protein [Spirochaetia bacterium]
YIFVWLVLGLVALVVGVVVFPNVSKTLSNLGTAWLGVAVGAAYAYFAIRPPQSGPAVAAPPHH